MPEISIIIPIYNKAKYLKRSIESVLNQSFSDYELLLIDDGSTDASSDICELFSGRDSRIKVFHKTNGGVSSARNLGIDKASGNYIAFVDADDWAERDMFKRLYELVKTNNADIASVSYMLADDDSKILVNREGANVRVFNREEAVHNYLLLGLSNRIQDYAVWAKLYKRDLFKDTLFPENQIYEDMILNLRLILKSKCYVKSDEILYYYYQSQQSIIRHPLSKRDFDLFKTNSEIKDLIYKNEMKDSYKIVEGINARTPMSLLIKACVYGIDEKISKHEEVIFFLRKRLRNNLSIILHSTIPLSRKLASIILCFCPYPILELIIKRKKNG